jgi:hypothetical protein
MPEVGFEPTITEPELCSATVTGDSEFNTTQISAVEILSHIVLVNLLRFPLRQI